MDPTPGQQALTPGGQPVAAGQVAQEHEVTVDCTPEQLELARRLLPRVHRALAAHPATSPQKVGGAPMAGSFGPGQLMNLIVMVIKELQQDGVFGAAAPRE